jgi:transcriptional regulator with XRE-family HTH domain
MPLSAEQRRQIKVFGTNVRRERTRKSLTQERLAEMADLYPRTLQKIEAGKLNILLTTMLRIQKALGCSWEALLGRPTGK